MQLATIPPLRAPVKIAILALDGAVYSSIIGPMDVFSVANELRSAAGQQAFAQVRILRVGRQLPLSFNQLNIHTHDRIDAGDRFDVVILPAMMGLGDGHQEVFRATPRCIYRPRRC